LVALDNLRKIRSHPTRYCNSGSLFEAWIGSRYLALGILAKAVELAQAAWRSVGVFEQECDRGKPGRSTKTLFDPILEELIAITQISSKSSKHLVIAAC